MALNVVTLLCNYHHLTVILICTSIMTSAFFHLYTFFGKVSVQIFFFSLKTQISKLDKGLEQIIHKENLVKFGTVQLH